MMDQAHTVKAYDEELRQLAQLVRDMAEVTMSQIGRSMNALVSRDEALASQVIAADDAVDELQRGIETMVIQMIGRRQPMARDLRDIVAALRISIELERVGDLAKNVSKRVAALQQESYPHYLMRRLQQMADLALRQLKDVLDSYAELDAEKAVAVWTRDEEIDAAYTSLFRELLTYMMEEPRNIAFSTHMLFCAKNIERIGDHVTNIAESVHYMVLGVPLKEDRPKGDCTTMAPVPASP